MSSMRRAIQPTRRPALPHISARTGSENLQMLAMPAILRFQIAAHQPLILAPLPKPPPADKRRGSNNEQQSIEPSNDSNSTKPARSKRLQSSLSLNIASETNTATTTDTNPSHSTRRQQPSIRCSRRPVHSQLERRSQDLHVSNVLENIRQSAQPKRPPENPHRISSIRMRRLQA